MVRLTLWMLLPSLLAYSTPTLAADEMSASSRPTVGLELRRAPEAMQCADESTVRNAVAARLGYVPWSNTSTRMVRASIEQRAGVLYGEVEIFEGAERRGGRSFTSSNLDCRELVAAMELAICIAIDPLSGGHPAPPSVPPETPEPPGLPSPQASTAAITHATDDDVPAGPLAAQGALQLVASVGASATAGTAPHWSAGGTVQLAIGSRSFSLAVEGRADLPRSVAVANGSFDTSLALGALVPCVRFGSLFTCLVAGIGGLRASGHNLDAAASATAPYGTAGARLQYELPLSPRVFLQLRGDLLAAVSKVHVRDTFSKTDLWTTPPFSVAIGVAVATTAFEWGTQ